MIGRPPDYREVIHPRRLATAVYLLAERPPCIQLRDRAAQPRGRDYRTTRLSALADLEPVPPFVVAVLLCPGDSTQELTDWMTQHDVDPERVVFFLHPDTDPVEAMASWYDGRRGDPVAFEARTWTQLARPLGQFVNDWIYVDAVGAGWPL